jgi:hypothetical protein
VDDNIIIAFHNIIEHWSSSIIGIDGGGLFKTNAHYVTIRSFLGTHLGSY